MAAHTPGPWTVSLDEEEHTWSIDARKGERRLGYPRWMGLALVFGSEDEPHIGDPIGEANARLIAAAPQMLAAMKEVFRLANESPLKAIGITSDAMRDLRAAISAAEGKA